MLDVYNDKCIVELHLYSMSYLKSSKSLMVSKVNDSVFKLHLFHNLRGVELKQKNDMYVCISFLSPAYCKHLSS